MKSESPTAYHRALASLKRAELSKINVDLHDMIADHPTLTHIEKTRLHQELNSMIDVQHRHLINSVEQVVESLNDGDSILPESPMHHRLANELEWFKEPISHLINEI